MYGFLDVQDKRDASLSRFSVKTDRTHEPCVPTIFGLMTDWSHELRSSTNKCKKRDTPIVWMYLFVLFYCYCSGLLLYDDFGYCAVDAKDVNASTLDIEFIGRCGGFG